MIFKIDDLLKALFEKGAIPAGKVNFDIRSSEISVKKSIKERIKNAIRNVADRIARTPHDGYVMAMAQGPSMDPLFKHGANVPVKLTPSGAQYKKGDIIVFERIKILFLIESLKFRI